MKLLEIASLLVGSGVFAQGCAALHWAMRIEKRVTVLELSLHAVVAA